jgi:hypothetical protein
VRLEIEHDDNIDPDEVINECDYHFTGTLGKIVDEEITETSHVPFEMPFLE